MRFIILFIALFFSLYTQAQGQLSLKIVDENKSAIEYANFRLFSVVDSSVVAGEYSNSKGKVIISDIPFGKYYGKITFFDFKDKIVNEIVFSSDQKKTT
ncbi:hypothetical protein CW751_03910 [Brumimicrobium salinarum]|uniref:Uncharacterized protein n=1 Tax=Brumimicrobium salinarum TaxID=2058658 RepID=A0A2I0R507_9FLAO|nr:hypothetical protein [Brumimicrobium salinarum]PKR81681.1 hypothetical protein CW751_03910 [Brumimicrobium salinarum]